MRAIFENGFYLAVFSFVYQAVAEVTFQQKFSLKLLPQMV